jgi:hypothetical protein
VANPEFAALLDVFGILDSKPRTSLMLWHDFHDDRSIKQLI